MCIPCKCMEWVPSWRVSQLVKTFTVFYGIWRFRTVFTVAHHLSIFWSRLIHCMLSHPVYFKVHWNIDLLRTPRSGEIPLSSWFPHQNPVCISFLPHMCYTSCQSHPPSLIALMILSAEYSWQGSITVQFSASCRTFCHLGRNCLPWHSVLQTPSSIVLHIVRDLFLHTYK